MLRIIRFLFFVGNLNKQLNKKKYIIEGEKNIENYMYV